MSIGPPGSLRLSPAIGKLTISLGARFVMTCKCLASGSTLALDESFADDIRSLDRLLGHHAIGIENQRYRFLEVFARCLKGASLRVRSGQFLHKRHVSLRHLHENGREFYRRHTGILLQGGRAVE